MGFKFRLFIIFFVLFAVLGSIEAKGIFRGSSSRRGSSSSSSRPTHTSTNRHKASSGSFLHSERGHGSSSDPFKHATAPVLNHGHGNSNHSPFRPFGTVPPPRNTGNYGRQTTLRPFGTVPPPRNTGNYGRQTTFKPFGTVPPPRNTDLSRPGTPPPYGFVPPNKNGSPISSGTSSQPTISPIIHPNHQPIFNPHSRPGSHSSHYNTSTGIRPPSPGFNVGPTSRPPIIRPPTSGRYNNTGAGTVIQPTNTWTANSQSRPGSHGGYRNTSASFHPPPPGSNVGSAVQQRPYPTQGPYPGGFIYPQQYPHTNGYQPTYHPSYPNVQPGHVYHQPGPSLPPNPGHTVIVVPGQSVPSRTTGDVFQEALIFAGVNAAVNRITSPHRYYDHYHYNSYNYGTPPQGSSVTNTHIVNNNYYDQSSSLPSHDGGISNPSQYYPPQVYPGSGVKNENQPSGVIYPSGNSGSQSSQRIPGSSGNLANPVNPQTPSNGQSYPNQNNGTGQTNSGYNWPAGVSNDELWNLTEKLFNMDENNASKYISLNLQNQTTQNDTNVTDLCPQPLFSIQPEAYQILTIKAIHSLFEFDSAIENKTHKNSRKEEAFLIDLFLNTNVMTTAMHYLAQKKLIKNDYFEQKDALKHIWFTPYDGSSSGFKRVFQGEAIAGEVLYGIQDWIAFDFYEKSGRANYLSYIQKIDLGENASILKVNFETSGIKKTGTALFVGMSPELEMALYTICHYTRPNNYCVISLGGTQFTIYTHTFRYFGHDLIDLAFPIV